jgi:hypothetical protein
MAEITVRGYVNYLETKTSQSGNTYKRFKLGVQQKRKGPGGVEVKDKLTFNCTDFGNDTPEEGSYVELHGYLTIYPWSKDGKSGTNLDVLVKGYKPVEARSPGAGKLSAPRAPKATEVVPEDPFALPQGDDGIPF